VKNLFKIFYYVPFYYGIHTRTKGFLYKLSFILIIFLPPLFIIFFENSGIDLYSFTVYLIGFAGMYSIYEIGYIINDAYTVIYEEKPTLYISENEFSFLRGQLLFIIAVKLLFSFSCCLLLYFFNIENLSVFLVSLFLLLVSYLLHNNIRSNLNPLTMFLLNYFKYLTVLSLFLSLYAKPDILILTCSLIPVPRGILYTAKPRFRSKYHVKDIDKFQIKYYLIATIVVSLLAINKIINAYWIMMYFYLLLFRIIVFCYIKISNGGTRKKVEEENAAKYFVENKINRGGGGGINNHGQL
jgi:hypothetical protein